MEPTGPLDDDPYATDTRFPGTPTRSHRTRRPLRVLDEVRDWQGHAPDVLAARREHLARRRELGVEAIDD